MRAQIFIMFAQAQEVINDEDGGVIMGPDVE
jgi:hypothetical protein